MHLSPLVRVIDQFAVSHQTTLADLIGHSTSQPLAGWRQELYYLLYMDPSKPTIPAIGRRLDRDHATVTKGIRRYCERACIPVPNLSRRPGPKPRPQPAPELQQEA